MRSTDVIHSLYIPAFRAKKDIVPGRYNYMWFQPTKASEKVSDKELSDATEKTKLGEAWDYEKHQFTPEGYRYYDLYCTEYCGQDHSQMQTVVVVHETQADLDAWLKKVGQWDGVEPAVVYGAKLYNSRGCKSCHSIDGTKKAGPSYQDSFGTERMLKSGDKVKFDEQYVRESVLEPRAKIAEGYQPVMPSYKGQLSDDDIYCLTQYIKSLSKHSPKDAATKAAESDGADTKEEPAAE